MPFASLFAMHGVGVWGGLRREPMYNEDALYRSSHTLALLLKGNVAGERLSTMKRSRQLLSPNAQIYILNLNPNINLAMGDKTLLQSYKLNLCYKRILVFPFCTLNVFRLSGITISAFTHFLSVDVLYVQNISSSFNSNKTALHIPQILLSYFYMCSHYISVEFTLLVWYQVLGSLKYR